MKRIVVCMDGTWQNLSQDRLTNIGIIARSIAHKQTVRDPATGAEREIQQIVIYTQGVGSTIGALSKQTLSEELVSWASRTFGGALGVGLEDGVVDTYLRVAFNYEAGDEIYIFGFSRGAFAARRLAGFINAAGIVSRRHADKAREGFRLYNEARDANTDEERAEQDRAEVQFRLLYGKGAREADGTRRAVAEPPPITYLGVFDTVVQRGVRAILAAALKDTRYKFRNLRVCPNVLSARHAVAIDESRLGFPSTPWEGLDEANATAWKRPGADPSRLYYDQRWFVGTHGDVGGGTQSRLSALALKWITEGAAAQGLRFYQTHGEDASPLDDALREADLYFEDPITYPSFWRALQPMNYPLSSRQVWRRREKPTLADVQQVLDPSVLARIREKRLRYRPGALAPFRKVFRDMEGSERVQR